MMKAVSIILGALTLGMGSLAAPAAESDSTLSNLVYHWHGCGAGILCHSDSDCQASQDCIQTAQGDPSHVHCGQDSYPNSCWAEWFTQ